MKNEVHMVGDLRVFTPTTSSKGGVLKMYQRI